MLDSLREWIGTKEFIQVFYNSWVNLEIQFAKRNIWKRNIWNTIWRIGIWHWNHLVLHKFKEQEPFKKTYFETQLFYKNSLV